MSDIIKSNFISFSEQKKKIETVSKNNPKIIGKSAPKKSDEVLLDEVDYPELFGESAEEIEAKKHLVDEQEIESIKEEARQSAYQEGFELGRKEGFDVGYEEGALKAEGDAKTALEKETEKNKKELEALKAELIDEYTSYKLALEPKMLEIIENLVIKLIGFQKVSRQTILYLIKSGLDEIEIQGDLVIKVSPEDLKFVQEHEKEIKEDFSEKISIEILKDQELNPTECVIETGMGTIDCSLDTQLESLMLELKMLKESIQM